MDEVPFPFGSDPRGVFARRRLDEQIPDLVRQHVRKASASGA